MKLPSFTTNNFGIRMFRRQFFPCFLPLLIFSLLPLSVFAQRFAFILPEKNQQTEKIVAQLSESLKTVDADLVEIAVKNQNLTNIYNLSTEEAKTLASSIGCEFFIILKSENLRRTSFTRPTYFESYAVIYLVSARTGRLVHWVLKSFEGDAEINSQKQLLETTPNLLNEINNKIKSVSESELNEAPQPNIEELPAEDSPAAKNFKSPLPYKRIRPEYTRLANLYGIAATVDAQVDLDENGQIMQIEILRWAGYELEESVRETIRAMNWRPASRDGKNLPVRVLLRYNFRKIEKE